MQMKCHFICCCLISWIILPPSVYLCCFHFGCRCKLCARGMVVSVARWRDDSVRDLTPGSLALSPVPLWSWQQVSIGRFSGEGVPLEQVANLYLGLTSPQKALFSTFSSILCYFPHPSSISLISRKGNKGTYGLCCFSRCGKQWKSICKNSISLVFFFFLYSSKAPQLEQ